jgi:hypothetical protein
MHGIHCSVVMNTIHEGGRTGGRTGGSTDGIPCDLSQRKKSIQQNINEEDHNTSALTRVQVDNRQDTRNSHSNDALMCMYEIWKDDA